MSTKVNLKIRGLVACFLDADEAQWNIVFLGDDVHPVNFTYKNSHGDPTTTPLRKKWSDLKAVFEPDSFIDALDRKGEGFNTIFNMAGGYAHGADKLRIHRRKKTTDLVWLKVPHASLKGGLLTDREYYVQEFNYPGSPAEVIPKIAKELNLSFSFEGSLKLKVSDPADTSYNPSFSVQTGAGDIELEFDNDCDKHCTHNDFVELYELLMEHPDDRKFVAGQLKPRRYTDWGSPPVEEADAKSAEYGNCDPVVIEPPPG